MRTGFVNLLNTFEIKTVASKVAFLKKLSGIYYDNDINEFVFEFTWQNIGCILKDEELSLYDEWIRSGRYVPTLQDTCVMQKRINM